MIIFETGTVVASSAPGQLGVHLTKNYEEADLIKCSLVVCLADINPNYQITDEQLEEILINMELKGFTLQKSALNLDGARIISTN